MKLFELFGFIDIDNKEADKSLDETEKKAGGLGEGFKKASKVIAIAMLAAGVAILGIATKTSTALDRIDKLSQQLGLSRESFQEWDFILSQAGIDIDSMSTGFKTLTDKTAALTEGNAAAEEAFGKLGISVDDVKGKTQEEIFEMTIEALQGMEEGTEKAALANDLFGRSGQDLAPLINASAESVEKLREKAHDLNIIMSDEAVDAGVKFTDSIDQLKRMGVGLISEMMIPLVEVIDEGIQGFIGLKDWVEKNKTTMQLIGVALLTVTALVLAFSIQTALSTAKLTLWAAISAGATGVTTALGVAFTFLTSPIGLIILAIAALIAIGILIVKNWDTIKEKAIKIWSSISDWFDGMWEGIKGFFSKAWDFIKKLFDFEPLLLVKKSWDAVVDFFAGIGDKVKETFTEMIDKAKNWGKDLIGGFVKGITAGIQKVKDAVSSIARTVKDYMGFSVPEKGDLSDADEYGGDFIDLFTGKMNDRKNKLIASVKSIASDIDLNINPARLNDTSATINGSGGIVQNITINSITPLDPVETARLNKQAAEELAFGW